MGPSDYIVIRSRHLVIDASEGGGGGVEGRFFHSNALDMFTYNQC